MHDICADTICRGPQSTVFAKRGGAGPASAIPLYRRAANITPKIRTRKRAPTSNLAEYFSRLYELAFAVTFEPRLIEERTSFATSLLIKLDGIKPLLEGPRRCSGRA